MLNISTESAALVALIGSNTVKASILGSKGTADLV